MSHKFETGAIKGERWHGLGADLDGTETVKETLIKASIDWLTEKRPLMMPAGKDDMDRWTNYSVPVAEAFALCRNTDSKRLSIVGPDYEPTQNHEAFEFFKLFVEAGKATLESAGSLDDGRYVWGLARLGMDFELPGNDKVQNYILVACPHVQGKALVIQYTNVRVVCWNTLSLALKSNGSRFRMIHRHKFDAGMIEQAQQTLGIARDMAAEFEANARRLAVHNMSDSDVLEFLAGIVDPGNADVLEKGIEHGNLRLRRIMEAYEQAPGAQPGTAWGVLNAVSYWTDHMASRTADRRLTNAWLGTTAALKAQTLDALLRIA